MKQYRKELLLGVAAISAMVAFSLIILPGILVWVYPSEQLPQVQAVEKEGSKVDIKVYRHESKTVETVALEEYVLGVVSGEMPSSFEPEALKAQAVAARTYGLSKVRRSVTGNPTAHPTAPLCDDTHCQVYRTASQLQKLKGDLWMAQGYAKIAEAVTFTAGQVMYYEGALVEQPLFHSSSGGKTENSEDVFTSALPYLRSVASPYEKEAPHQAESISVGMGTFADKIREAYPKAGSINKRNIKILERSAGGRVETMGIGKAEVSGRRVRDLFGLRSANFTVRLSQEGIVFTTAGYGHGVGMSQYGANGMAKAGYGYVDILRHYYSGIEVKEILD